MLASFASDRVQLAGWVSAEQVYRYFLAADLVFFPGLHSVLWEQALACKVPCVFSKLEGFGHVDVPGALLLKERSVETCGALLDSLLDDVSLTPLCVWQLVRRSGRRFSIAVSPGKWKRMFFLWIKNNK